MLHAISSGDVTIGALTAVSSVVDTHEFHVNESGQDKKATATQIKTFVNGLTFLGRTQLGAAAANITVSFTGQDGFFICVAHIAGSSASDIARLRPNGDTGNNYSTVSSEPSDAAGTSTTSTAGLILGETGQTVARSPVYCFVNKPSSGQVAFMRAVQGDGSDAAATAITMIDSCAVWANTSASISSFVLNGGAGGSNLTSGSYLEVYGVRNA